MADTSQSSQVKDPMIENMQKYGMSSTGIIKALAGPLLKDLNVPKDAKEASALIMASDVVTAQTGYSVKQNIDTSDVVMDKIGAMCELIELIIDKKPKAISQEFIENFNNLVAKTNMNSSELWKLLEDVKQTVQDKNVTQSELLSMSQGGKISGAELVIKLREQHTKVKEKNLTAKNSLMNQSNMLTANQTSTERPIEKTQTEIFKLMNFNRLTLDNVQKKPVVKQEAQPVAQSPINTTSGAATTTAPSTTKGEGGSGGGLHR